MTLHLQVGLASHIGDHRDVNQDAAYAASWGAGVADGVGGGPAGDLASASFLHRLVAGGPARENRAALEARIRTANWDLSAHVRRDPSLRGMATTFTGLWLTDGRELYLAHTGDSRAYRLRDGAMKQRTRDDSFVQELLDSGIVTPQEARVHPHRNIITASLQGDAYDHALVTHEDVRLGDRWLLVSDGVSDYLSPAALEMLLLHTADPHDAAVLIAEAALHADSRDNVTAVVCDVVSGAVSASDVRFAGSASTRYSEHL